MRKSLAVLLAISIAFSFARAVEASDRSALRTKRTEAAQLTALDAAQYETQSLLALEPAVLAASRARATRSKDILRLHTRRGGDVVLQSQTDCDGDTASVDKCTLFALVADLKSLHAFVVYEAAYEGGTYLLIDDRSGRRWEIDAPPHFGPSSDRFVTVDDGVAYGCSCVAIWKFARHTWKKEWTYTLPEFSVESISWRGRLQVAFEYNEPADSSQDIVSKTAMIVHKSAGWAFIDLGPRRGPSTRR